MTLAGTWQNEYGSQMVLSEINANLVWGQYSSTTGSTGKYMVIGYQQTANPKPAAGQAVALAIEWHSIVAGPGDPSWNWSSGLSGQISIQNGKESLVLAHAMVASSDFSGLAAAGTYIDKLTYFRTATAPDGAGQRPQNGAALADPLQGTWESADGTMLAIQVYPYTGSQFGWAEGKMLYNGIVCPIEGVTDINAQASGLNLQSTAITALPTPTGPAIALAGCLDYRNGRLTLTNLTSQSTASNATYVETTVSQLTFVRVGDMTDLDKLRR
ncbi:avidin/streptavidin family protein [Sphingomonas flavalba]|uniref:avidin/streptavidin family protein n=1 Tax=Sphingomonas flavalba TaxID=2559804 RepID=UPI00109E047E|nr:avidin/streptavidin family protein [Sphingomonas flavalba]